MEAVKKIAIEKYSAYKDSGVEWLGAIPEHWKVESFKNILTERNEKNDPIRSTEILSLSINKGVTLYAEKTTNLDRFKDDFTQYKLAHKGDLVLNSMNMIVGAVGISDYFGCVSPVYYTYHGGLNNYYTTKFYEYLFRCKTVQGVLYSLGRGLIAIDRGEGKYNTLRLKFSRDDLRSLRLPYPNLQEQAAIATFLDRKTALIEQAIGIKEKQIVLLKERRQILIHKAVTRGLNPNVKMKDSGVEWIGEIPVHWDIISLRRLAKDHKQGYYTEKGYTDDGCRLIRITDLNAEGDIDTSTSPSVIPKQREFELFQVRKNDFLFPRTGTIGLLGLATTDLNAVFASYLIRFRFSELIKTNFLRDYFVSDLFLNGLKYDLHGGVVQNIHAENIKNQLIPFPPLKEQENISQFIAKISIEFKKIISLKEKEIEKLKEYKARLINSAVTGKIKVC